MDLSGIGICDDEIASRNRPKTQQRSRHRNTLSPGMTVSETITCIQNIPINGILNLSNNNIYENGAIQILKAVSTIDGITEIDLSSNRISSTEVSIFMSVLYETSKTTKVYLSHNPVYNDIVAGLKLLARCRVRS